MAFLSGFCNDFKVCHLLRLCSILMVDLHSMKWVCHLTAIHLSAGVHLGCFYFLVSMNSASVSIGINVCLKNLLNDLRSIPTAIAVPHGNSV